MQAKFNSENPHLDNEFLSELVGTDSDLSGTSEHPHGSPAEPEGDIEEQRSTIPFYKQGGVKSALILGLSAIPIGGLGYMMFGNSGQKSPIVAANPNPEPTAPKADFTPDPRFATMQNKLAMQEQTRGLEDAAKAQEAERLAKAAADAKTAAATPNPQATPVTPAPAVTPVTHRSAPPTNVEPPARSIPPIAPVKPIPIAPAITPAPQPRVTKEPKAKPPVVAAKPQPVAFKPQPVVFKPQPVAKTAPQRRSNAKVAIVKPQPDLATGAIIPKVQVSWQEATDNAIGVYGEKAVSKTVAQSTPESVQQSVGQPVRQPIQQQTISQPIPQPVTQPVTSQIYQQPVVQSDGQPLFKPVGQSSPQQIPQLNQPFIQQPMRLVPQSSTIKNAPANYVASIDPRSYSEALPQPAIESVSEPVVQPISQYSKEKDNYKDNTTFTVAQAVVIPGQNRMVSLISPMQIIPGETGQEILLQLEQGFADTNGGVPIPDGTRIIAMVTVASNGLIRIVSAIAIVNGENIPIDAGSLILSGTDNSPVIAQYKQFDQGEIGRRDLQTFLAGAASGLGKVLTQPNTSVQVSTNGTAVVSSTSNPNTLGGVLDGGATPTLEAWAKRNETEIKRLESASRLWYLPMGYKMTIVAVKPFAVR